ncbi:hypothetical protein A1Q1_02844 [Trichosporon asahii var. asahii CBS 2479]|uniref:Uncharacterized protein n=1 Tax=Trichosporon asahii var. asahii (strain ATCC 90039 / CBS 2479 / JCM 2466 / KCTC 7840 / NBRC 103889/ NCYC 2677 / UAMH 7654) TaxID=1186058 RepID=J4UBC6_TRIAS|nr:hypothetical protein A1Q1_02844 [Trichosporon asahii var. asahii CBS 2479]EJT48140.1 hypothetical protein A1Q1_02844 [Trichosporon asahii var. asahii CBS 2479]
MSEAAEEMTSLNNRLEESERRVQDLTRQVAEERAKIEKLRTRNATLEQQLASYGSISTPPLAKRRVHPAMAPQGLHPQQMQQARHVPQQHLSPEVQYVEPDPHEQAAPVPMSPLVTARHQAPYPAVPSTPLPHQRIPRGARPSSVMPPDMLPQPRHMPPPSQHMPPVQQYAASHDGQDYPAEPVRADYPAKRQRLDQGNAYGEQGLSNRYSRATTATPFEHRRMANSEPTPGGRPHSSASFQGRPRNNLDQYRYRGEQQVSRPQPLQYDPKPSFTLPRRSQATPSGEHPRHGHMYGVTPLGAIGEDDGELGHHTAS